MAPGTGAELSQGAHRATEVVEAAAGTRGGAGWGPSLAACTALLLAVRDSGNALLDRQTWGPGWLVQFEKGSAGGPQFEGECR